METLKPQFVGLFDRYKLLYAGYRRLTSHFFAPFFLVLIAFPVYGDYSQHDGAKTVIQQLVEQHNFTVEEVSRILSYANTEQRILDSMANAAEKKKTWTAYRKAFIKPLRIKQGVKFLLRYQATFTAMEKEYGVPREIIAAIIGVETNYGSYTGKANVLDALATLAFEHPRRAKFFTSELVEFIVLSREQGWTAETQLGSYAGAMGMSQFMPSNYRRLAIDGDKNGVVDLHKPLDAIESVANYFVHHGWLRDEPVTHRAAVNTEFKDEWVNDSIKPRHTVAELADAGFYSQEKTSPAAKAGIIRFNDADGDEFWLGYHNFYVVSRYNPRSKYAMAVFQLSEEIAKAYNAEVNKTTEMADKRVDVKVNAKETTH